MKIYSLQILRGISASIVLLLHILQKSGIQPFGYYLPAQTAVDIFFVLSGFIIIFTLRENDTWKNFAIKRAFRLFPIYLVLLAVYYLFYINFTGENIPNAKLILNIFLLPYGDQLYKSFIIGVAWSTAFELFFYVLVTLLLVLKVDKKKLPLYVLISIFCIFVTVHLIDRTLTPSNFALFRTVKMILGSYHLFMFVVGVMIYYLFSSIEHLFSRKNTIILFSISNVLFISNLLLKYNPLFAFVIVPLVFISWLLMEQKKILNFESFYFRRLVFLGDISYSIYLIQISIIYFSQNIYAISILSILATLLLSSLTYKYIESPFVKMGKKISSKFNTKIQ